MSYFYCTGTDPPTEQSLASGYYLLEGHFGDDTFYMPRMDMNFNYTKDLNDATVCYYDANTHIWHITYLNWPCSDPKDPYHTWTVPKQNMFLTTDTYNSSPLAEKLEWTTGETCYGGVPPRPLVLMSDGSLCEPGQPKNMVGIEAYTNGTLALNKDDGTSMAPSVTCVVWRAIPMNTKGPTKSGSYSWKVHLQADLSDTPMFVGYNPNDGSLQITGKRSTLWYFDAATNTWAVQPNLHKIPQPADAAWLQAADSGGVVTANTSQNNALQILFPDNNMILAGLAFGPNGVLRSVNGQLQLPIFSNTGVTVNGINVYIQCELFIVPSNYEVLKSMLVEITDKTNPNFIACQGGPGRPETQVCFYNHSPTDPLTPVFPSISYDPNIYIGYPRASLGLPSVSGIQADPMLYLTTPNDAMQLNQMQVSTCLQDDCGCPGQNPDTCKASPDGYCRCADSSHQNDICGFQCRPGLKAHRLNDCRYDPVNLINVVHYQCFPEIFVGTTDPVTGAQSCCSYVGPAVNQPKGPKFNTMEACYENFVTKCPPGYEFHANLARPGCYRTRDWTELLACNTTGHCPGDAGQCANDSTWHASCSGSCDGHCDCFCEDWSQVPPYGFYCDNGGHNGDHGTRNDPKWIQNKSSSWLSIPRGSVRFNFGHTGAWNYGLDSFCQIGTTGYGPDYIGPSGVSTCTNN